VTDTTDKETNERTDSLSVRLLDGVLTHIMQLRPIIYKGADSIYGTRARASPISQMAGHGGTVSRTANKKLTKLYWPLRKRSPKRLIVLLEPK